MSLVILSSCSQAEEPFAPSPPSGDSSGDTGTTTSPPSNHSSGSSTSPTHVSSTAQHSTTTGSSHGESWSQTSERPSTGVNPPDRTSDESPSDTGDSGETVTETTEPSDESSSDTSSDDTTDPTSAGETTDSTDTDSDIPDNGNLDPNRKFVGNITTGNQIDAVNLQFSNYWDQITPENAGKWGSVQSSPGAAFNWGTLDALYDYAEEHGLIFKQHAFVWGRQEPGNAGSVQPSDVQSWMQAFCSRYPKTKLIDVVNEPPPHTTPAFINNIGGGTDGNWQWITNAFTWAREACPDAILILNDYNNIEWPNDNQHFIDIVKTVLENGGPIDALGAQSHDLDQGQVTFQRVQELLNKLHNDTGLPVYITEMDIDTTDDQRQLEQYQQFFPYFMETEFIPGITIWGWIYGRTWSSAPNSGLVRDSGQPRPAMTWLMNELGRPSP